MRVGGFGYPIADATLAIVNPETSVICPPDVVGEIWVINLVGRLASNSRLIHPPSAVDFGHYPNTPQISSMHDLISSQTIPSLKPLFSAMAARKKFLTRSFCGRVSWDVLLMDISLFLGYMKTDYGRE